MELTERRGATVAATEALFDSVRFLERPAPDLPVWQLRRRTLSLIGLAREAEKVEILTALGVTSEPVILVYSEDPLLDDVPGQWERLAEDTWRLLPNENLPALVHWLQFGGWMMYSAESVVESTDLLAIGFAPTPESLCQAIARFRLRFLVISFHDDVLWTIALRTE